jgi:hypothetical protein
MSLSLGKLPGQINFHLFNLFDISNGKSEKDFKLILEGYSLLSKHIIENGDREGEKSLAGTTLFKSS